MKLGSTRELSGLKPVLKDPEAIGPDPVYWVFNDVMNREWANITITVPGNFNGEYPKTFGHYHGVDTPETYHVIEGEGVMLLQRKHLEDGSWDMKAVDKVYLVRAKAGDEITILPEYGHSWSNVGNVPLITYDNWTAGHSPSDYEPIEKLKGMAYYLVEENGKVKAIPNPSYTNIPEPVWTNAQEFKNLS